MMYRGCFVPKAQSIKISDAYTAYRLDAQARGVTPQTLRTYTNRIEPFIRWCEAQGVTTLQAITPTLARSYLVHLQERNLSSYTVNGIGRAVRAFINFCVAEGMLAESPMRRVIVPKVDKKIMPSLSEDDASALLAACQSERDEAVLLFLLDTGLRAGEFVGLDGRDIDISTGAVLVRQGKGNKDRVVYLGVKTRKQLIRYFAMERGAPGDNEPVWLSATKGVRLTTSGLAQILERLGQRAGVKHCSPHVFRRTFALWSLRAGMSLFHLQRLMGHEDLQVLRRYVALVEGDAKEAHKKYGAVDRILT